jgi:hypothetical protein
VDEYGYRLGFGLHVEDLMPLSEPDLHEVEEITSEQVPAQRDRAEPDVQVELTELRV